MDDLNKEIEKLAQVIKEAKEIKEAYESENGITSTRISNKDLLFWLITKHYEQDTEIGKLKEHMKMIDLFLTGFVVVMIINIILGW